MITLISNFSSPLLDRVYISTICLVLFIFRIDTSSAPYFDEMYYVPAARSLIEGIRPANIEHPLVAKTLIASSMLLLGDNAFAWRLPSAICGAIAIGAIHWIIFQLFSNRLSAICAGFLVLFDQTFFVEARIATLEMPTIAALVFGGACLMRGSVSTKPAAQWNFIGAIALGLAMGAKWLALPYTALFLVLSAWNQWRSEGWAGDRLIKRILPQMGILSLISAGVYFSTFWPAFLYQNDALTLGTLMPFQQKMWALQHSVPNATHPYQSNWWQWPLMQRPIWYLFISGYHSYEIVFLIGNPLIYWGGLVFLFSVFLGWPNKRSGAMLLFAGIYVFSVLIWALIAKPIGYLYYYDLSAIILCLVVVSIFENAGAKARKWLFLYTAACGAMFFYFYPIISAWPIPNDDTWTHWLWLRNWR